VTIRKLLLILFLYILLVWIVAAYLHFNDVDQLVKFGLLWTLVGVAVLLCGLLLEWIMGWRRSRRKQEAQPATAPATAPAAAPAGPVVLTEDDNTLIGLIREADQRLAQAPGHAASGPGSVLDLPLILAMGPERSGKTAVIHHSGLEPSLLAGQAIGNDGTITSTRVANLWLAHESLLLEVSGRIFAGDRLAEFLRNLRPSAATGWKTWFTPERQPPQVRGILLFFDAREFMGTPEPSRLDRWAQAIRARLSTTAGFFGAECPVYVLFTNTDALPYFEDFFNGMAEAEVGQVLGLITETADVQTQGRVWAEAETRRLNQLFQTLFLRLSDRRLMALSQEMDPARRPSTYEFPREFRRIRAPLVQFLVDVFKPDVLNPGARLRGIFFTGTRKAEQAATPSGAVTQAYQARPVAPDATSIFAPGGATQVFRVKPKSGSGRVIERWIFATEFFQKVLRLDQPLVKPIPKASRFNQRSKMVAAVAAGVAALLALLWTVSWVGNWWLVSDVQTVLSDLQTGNRDLSMANLDKLEKLRVELGQLQQGFPWYLHWGLSQREGLQTIAEKAYFARLKQMSLERINTSLGVELAQAGSTGQQDANAILDRLKTYRTIAGTRACAPDEALVRRVLKETVPQAHPGLGEAQVAELDTQLDFYAARLAVEKNLPLSLAEVEPSVANARAFIRRQNGLEQRLRGMLSEISGQIKALSVPPEYRVVLSGPAQFRGEFTKPGREIFEDRVAHDNLGGEERCVMGESIGQQAVQALDAGAKDQLRSLYYRAYADAWREFLDGYSVNRYSNKDDASHKLDILSDSSSPLLGIVRMVADNTNFPPPKPGELTFWEKTQQKLGLGDVNQAKSAAQKAVGNILGNDAPLMTAADVATYFQPVRVVIPPPFDRPVNDNDEAYVQGLRKLKAGIDGMIAAPSTRDGQTAALTVANAALLQANDALKSLSDKFPDVGQTGLRKVLASLLSKPISLAGELIPQNADKLSAKTKNGDLQQVCQAIAPTLKKYPFSPNVDADKDATIDDVKNVFGPNGKVSLYTKQSGADLVILQGQTWEPKPDLQGLNVAPELLRFLDRTQDLKRALFADGNEPKFHYTLRRVEIKGILGIRFRLDGQDLAPDRILQTAFEWPAKSSADQGADGFEAITKDAESGFGDFPDLWGVFRLFHSADDRQFGPLNKPIVTWSKTRGKGGAAYQPLKPPAQVQIMDSSGSVDLFNPRFFDDLKCPGQAVLPN
jgi:type VI secretion system protein ImpL